MGYWLKRIQAILGLPLEPGMGAPRGLQRAFAFCAVYLRLETCLIPLVVGVEAWMKVLAEGEGLALDFVGTASDLESAEKKPPQDGTALVKTTAN